VLGVGQFLYVICVLGRLHTNKGVHQEMVRIRIPVRKPPFRMTGCVGCVLEPVVRKGPPTVQTLVPNAASIQQWRAASIWN
jgi:hypothetical protein